MLVNIAAGTSKGHVCEWEKIVCVYDKNLSYAASKIFLRKCRPSDSIAS